MKRVKEEEEEEVEVEEEEEEEVDVVMKVEEENMWKEEGRVNKEVEEQEQEGGRGYHLPARVNHLLARMRLQRVMKAEEEEKVAM